MGGFVESLSGVGSDSPSLTASVIYGVMVILLVVLGGTLAWFQFDGERRRIRRAGGTGRDLNEVFLAGEAVQKSTAVDVGRRIERRPPSTITDRLAALRELQGQGLITQEQADARVAEILREV